MSIGNNLATLSGKKSTSFWSTKEGKPAIVIGYVLLAFLGYKFVANIETILPLIRDTTYALALILGTCTVLGGLAIESIRTRLFFLYRSIWKTALSPFMELEVENIIKLSIEDMKRDRQDIGDEMENINGVIQRLEGVRDNNEKMLKDNLGIASAAKKRGNMDVAGMKAGLADQIMQGNNEIIKLIDKTTRLYKMMHKVYDQTGLVIETTEQNVKFLLTQREALTIANRAMNKAKRILNLSGENMIFQEAMDFVAADIARKKGEIKTFMDQSKDFLAGIDLQKQVYNDNGLKLLEKFEKGEALIFAEPERFERDVTPVRVTSTKVRASKYLE